MAILGLGISSLYQSSLIPTDWSPGVIESFSVNAYQPSLIEWGVGIGLVVYALLMFSLGLRYLPMFESEEHHDQH